MPQAGNDSDLPEDLPAEVRDVLVSMDFSERLEKARAKRASILAQRAAAQEDVAPVTEHSSRRPKRTVRWGLLVAGLTLAVGVPFVAERMSSETAPDTANAAVLGTGPDVFETVMIPTVVPVAAAEISMPSAADRRLPVLLGAPPSQPRADAPPALWQPLQVSLFVSKGAAGRQVRKQIGRAAHDVVHAQGTRHRVLQTHVRYFHADDAGAARRLAKRLNGVARVFTGQGATGQVEVWVSPREWPQAKKTDG